MRISNRGGRGVLPIILILSVLGIPLYAAGGSDSEDGFDPKVELEKAAAFIEEGRLDDAIQALVEIARRDPEQMERAQDLILDIRIQENEIKELFDQIQTVLLSEDLEPDEKLLEIDGIINQIKVKDSDPKSDTWKNLSFVESGLRQSLDELRREDFYNEASEYLILNKYKEAVDVYRSGFTGSLFGESQTYEKYRDAELPEDLDNYAENSARQKVILEAYHKNAPEGDRLISEIEAVLDSWNQNSTLLVDLEPSALETVSGLNPETWEDGMADYLENLTAISDEIQTVRILNNNLVAIKYQLYEDLDGAPEDFRYERIGSFMQGREEKESEGILYALEIQWENAYLRLFSRVLDRVRVPYQEGGVSYQSRLLVEAASLYNSSRNTAVKALELIPVSENYAAALGGGDNAERLYKLLNPLVLELQFTDKASEIRLQLIETLQNQPRTDDETLASLNLQEIQNLSENLQISINQYEAQLLDWNETMDLYADTPGADLPELQKISSELITDISELLNLLYGLRVNIFILYMEPRYNILESQVSNIQRRFSEEQTRAGNFIDNSRPAAALSQIIEPFKIELESLTDDVGDFLDTVTDVLESSTVVDDNQEFLGFRSKAESLLVILSVKVEEWQKLRTDAVNRKNAALRAEIIASAAIDEAEGLITSARESDINGRNTNNINESYRAKDLYISATAALGRANDLLLQVVLNDTDIADNSGIRERLSGLEAEALNAPRDLAVTVRDYAINDADKAFVERRYGEGLQVLLLAQEFWVSIFGEEDTRLRERIVRFRVVQQSAQNTVIYASDPLYMEMNQYLNLANRYYNEGLRLLPSGTANDVTPDALRAFRASEDLLKQVLNVFPGNASALLLKMKILQSTDFDEYNKTVRSLISDAETALRRDNREVIKGTDFKQGLDPQLQAVFSFDTGFPGLADTVNKLDIYLGRVIPEPSQTDINNSRQITAAVRNDWDQTKSLGGTAVSAASPNLIKRLDGALVLWEANNEAADLQDAIRFYTAPQPTPPELRLLIDRAEESMLQNSKSTVQILYDAIITQYPGFRNHPDVLKMKNWLDNR